jgi:hypothetical protein
VDAVTIFDEETPLELIRAIAPDVLVKGGDYRPDEIVGRSDVEAAGGQVVLVPLVEGCSTTNLAHRAADGAIEGFVVEPVPTSHLAPKTGTRRPTPVIPPTLDLASKVEPSTGGLPGIRSTALSRMPILVPPIPAHLGGEAHATSHDRRP